MHIAELSCAAVVPATIFWDLEAGVAAPSEKHLQTMRKVFELIARQRREAEAPSVCAATRNTRVRGDVPGAVENGRAALLALSR